jgi:hypothetical protein
MLFHPKNEARLGRLADELRLAEAVTPDLMSALIAEACPRFALLKQAGKAARIERLTNDGAWMDASLALIEVELPRWRLRRLCYEEGEWICSLSRQPNMPVEVDETADASHEVLSLAILGALLEASQRTSNIPETDLQAVPQVRPSLAEAVCTDNFA